MTTLSGRARKERLLRVFERTGASGKWTRPFNEMPDAVRDRLRLEAQPAEGEALILACYRDESHWVLLTSERLMVRSSTQMTRLPWSEISDATVGSTDVQTALTRRPKGKLDLERLTVVQANGRVVEIEVEPGPSFVGLWNVLKTVAVLRSRS